MWPEGRSPHDLLRCGAPVCSRRAETARKANAGADERLLPAGTTQPSIDLPAQRRVITAQVVVGRGRPFLARRWTRRALIPIGTAVKPEREASGAKVLQPIVVSVAALGLPPMPPSPLIPCSRLRQSIWRAGLAGRQSIDPAVGSISLAVQLGAPRSEAEAREGLKRLSTKYGSALRGSTVGLRKVLVNGETIYRLQVVSLSKLEAAALCSRVKGDGGSCTIVR